MANTSFVRAASVVRYYENEPQIQKDGIKSWIARAENFIVSINEIKSGYNIKRLSHTDEYMVFIPQGSAKIYAGKESLEAAVNSVTIVPPGDSKIEANEDSKVICFYSKNASDLLNFAINSKDYVEPNPNVAELVAWPTPADGFKLRNYLLDNHTKDDSNMRIFRSTNLMINFLKPRMVERDVSNLSPHSHEDFEQGSLAIGGDWIHHIRYPWVKDMNLWRNDEHIEVASPSLTVIPPNAIHTSRNTNSGGAWLLDIFSPPRKDFSMTPGKVANEADYPLPN